MATEEIGARLSLKGRREASEEARRFKKDIDEVGDAADKAGRKASSSRSGWLGLSSTFGGVRAGVGLMSKAVTAAGIAVGGATVLAGAKVLRLGMDAAETGAAFNTVFAGMTDQVNGFVKQMNTDFGIPTAELQQAATSFGVFGKAADIPTDQLADFSTSLVTAGTDLASFYNADPGDVFLALRSGLAGEAEPLRKFGIFLSDATMQAKAATMGLSGELTESQKVMVRQAIIMESLGDAEGDLARTSGGLANQWRGLKGRITEAGTAIGTALLPMATELTNWLNGRLQPAVLWLQNELPTVVTRAGEMITGIRSQMGNLFGAIADGDSQGIAEVIDNMFGNSGRFIEPIRELLDRLFSSFDNVATIVRHAIVPAFGDFQSIMPGFTSPLGLIERLLGFVADNAKLLRPILVGLAVAFTLNKLATMGAYVAVGLLRAGTVAYHVISLTIKAATLAWTAAQWLLNAAMTANPIGLVVLAIVALVAIFALAWKHSETFRNIVTGAFNAVLGAVKGVWNWVSTNWPLLLAILTGPIGLAVKWIIDNWDKVKAMFSGFKSWISDTARGMWDGIKNAFRSAINWIIRAWNGLEFKIPGFKIGPVGYDGFTLGVPDIPTLHEGGTTTRGGIVNIRPDEELVFLPPAATVVPLPAGNVAGAGGVSLPGDREVIEWRMPDGRLIAELVIGAVGSKVARL